MAHYVHHVPGRLRIKLPELKRNPQLAAAIETTVLNMPGVVGARINAVTGSLLVHYDGRLTTQSDLLHALPLPRAAGDRCPVCAGSATTAADSATAGLGTKVLGMAVEKALEHSARVMLGALL